MPCRKMTRELARDARVICEQLGPTFIKLAQTLSVRPDVLPPSALASWPSCRTRSCPLRRTWPLTS